MYKLFALPFFIFLLYFSFSCTKENSQIDYLPQYVIQYRDHSPNGDTSKIEYSGNRVVQISQGDSKTFYHYNNSGLLESTSYTRAGREETPLEIFSYSNGNLLKRALQSTNPETGIVSEAVTMEYVHYGDTMITMEYKDVRQGNGYFEKWYFNGSGNIFKSLKYYDHPNESTSVVSYTSYYDYDNSPTPTANIHEKNVIDSWNANNIIRLDTKDAQEELTNTQEFSYIYDESNFPIIKLSGNDTIEKYLYMAAER